MKLSNYFLLVGCVFVSGFVIPVEETGPWFGLWVLFSSVGLFFVLQLIFTLTRWMND